jgi:chemotaxis family two-component system sensor kinase Cph1
MRENAALVTHDPLPVAYGDPNQIWQVFHALIENSFKFCNGAAPRIHIGGATQGSGWLFSVRDNGIGIDPRKNRRIFSVFKRLNNDCPGAGMGLAIANGIIERHRGRIWVESQLGDGATFFFWLPKPAETETADDIRTSEAFRVERL